MKAVLEFDLPEENSDFQAAINGHTTKVPFGTLISYLGLK